MKVCTKCGEDKSLDGFYYNKRDKRYYGQCKACQRGATNSNKQAKPASYVSWCGMINRCTNPNDKSYKYYGAKGVTVHPRWRKYSHFLADMGERPPDPEGWQGKMPYWTLDRIDPTGDYEPANCRWATWEQQVANRRSARILRVAA